MAETFDRRITPARPDLAAASLRGIVAAPCYVAGETWRVIEEAAPLFSAPARDRPIDTQALFGETVIVYDRDDEGWAWAQLEDGYVGYLPAEALTRADAMASPTHRVCVPRTFVYPTAGMKLSPVMALPLGAQVAVAGRKGDFMEMPGLGFVWADHLGPHAAAQTDYVAIAEQFLDVPYLWGGKTFSGVDCSGLVQVALAAAGITAPRDTDMQARALGHDVAVAADLAGLRRGDLIFWKGHVGVMRDAHTLLHANGHHMMVASEKLADARDRIGAGSFGAIVAVRRLGAV